MTECVDASKPLGLGPDEYPGFPADSCPEQLPDLSSHHSVAAAVLRADPGLYDGLRGRRTPLGVGLARCIKTGMDNRCHPMIKTLGAVAGDEHCYETFRPLFDCLIKERHGAGCLDRPHAACLPSGVPALDMLSAIPVDPEGKYVLSSQIRVARSLQGIRFPPAIDIDERREVERTLVRALVSLEGDLKGCYYPLSGSSSYAPKLGGMLPAEEAELSGAGMLFSCPDASASLSSGMGRHWPDARGVFTNDSRSVAVWVNEEEHARAVGLRSNGDLQGAFRDVVRLFSCVEGSLRAHSDGPQGFACSDRLGFLTSSCANLGTAMRVSAILRVPLLAQRDSVAAWCSKRRLFVRGAVDASGAKLHGVLEVSNQDRLGISEAATVNLVVEAVAELVLAERKLAESGEDTLLQEQTTALVVPPPAPPVVQAAPVPAPPQPPSPKQPEPPQQEQQQLLVAEVEEEEEAELVCDADDEETFLASVDASIVWDVAGHTLGSLFVQASCHCFGQEPSACAATPAGAPELALAAAAAAAVEERERPLEPAEERARLAALLLRSVESGALNQALAEIRADLVLGASPASAPTATTAVAAAAGSGAVGSGAPGSGAAGSGANAVRHMAASSPGAVVATASAALAEDLELPRLGMVEVLAGAAQDGTLSDILTASPPVPEPVAEETPSVPVTSEIPVAKAGVSAELMLRSRIAGVVEVAVNDGTLDKVLRETAGELTRDRALLRVQVENKVLQALLDSPASTSTLKATSPMSSTVSSLLLATSGSDRRLGALTALIRQTEMRITEQEYFAQRLEKDLCAVQNDAACLEEEIFQTRGMVDEQEAWYWKLQEGLHSSRSEASTACTARDRTSMTTRDWGVSTSQWGLPTGGSPRWRMYTPHWC